MTMIATAAPLVGDSGRCTVTAAGTDDRLTRDSGRQDGRRSLAPASLRPSAASGRR